MLEYMEDFVRENPDKAMALGDAENVKFITGDPDIDKIENALAEGRDVDPNSLIDIFFGEQAKGIRDFLNKREIRRQSLLSPDREISSTDPRFDAPEGHLKAELDDQHKSHLASFSDNDEDW